MKLLPLIASFVVLSPVFCLPENLSVRDFYENVASIAKDSIGMESIPQVNGKTFTSDCIGFVDYVYSKAGLNLNTAYGKGHTGVGSLYNGLSIRNFIYKSKNSSPGDIIFFDRTYDSGGGNRWNIPLTHVAVVTGSGEFGTIFYADYEGSRIAEGRINLYYPDSYAVRHNDGSLYIINTFLRKDMGEGYEKKDYISSFFFNSFAHVVVKALR